MHHKYYISAGDQFHQDAYPDVIDELENIHRNTFRMSASFKSDIVISFLKDHRLEMHWIEKNPKLVKLLTSRSLGTSHMESLFDSCRADASFLSSFEACIKRQLQ